MRTMRTARHLLTVALMMATLTVLPAAAQSRNWIGTSTGLFESRGADLVLHPRDGYSWVILDEPLAFPYTVEFTEDLTADDWQPVAGFTWPIAETTWSGEDIGALGDRYYRVRSE